MEFDVFYATKKIGGRWTVPPHGYVRATAILH